MKNAAVVCCRRWSGDPQHKIRSAIYAKRRALILLLLALPCTLWGEAQFARADKPCEIAEKALKAAEQIRGLTRKRKVPCVIQDTSEIRNYLLSVLDTKLPKQKMEHEGSLLRALGFLPDDFNYREGLVGLYLAQLGGYYEPTQAHFVMAKAIPAEMQATIAVHELTHALQDQYFDMEKFIDLKAGDTDPMLARSALAEGDATAVMFDYLRRLAKQPPLAKEPDIGAFITQNVIGMSLSAPGDTPLSLQLMLLFPYASGLRFVQSVLHTSGYRGIDHVFKNPPRSTEEILHPEKYGKTPDFRPVGTNEVLPPAWQSGLQEVYTDVFGEFMVSIFVQEISGDKAGAAAAAEGWGGDRASIFQLPDHPAEHAPGLNLPPDTHWSHLVAWRIRWDSPNDAREFWAALSKKAPLPEGNFQTLRAGKAWRVVKSPEEALILVALGEGLPRLAELNGQS